MPKEYYRDYARAWRAKNKDKLRVYEHTRYHTKKKFQQRKKRAAGASQRCMFCNKLLDKDIRRKVYCKNCLEVPRLKTWLLHVYRLRAYQRKNGLPQTPIAYRDLSSSKEPEQPEDKH